MNELFGKKSVSLHMIRDVFDSLFQERSFWLRVQYFLNIFPGLGLLLPAELVEDIVAQSCHERSSNSESDADDLIQSQRLTKEKCCKHCLVDDLGVNQSVNWPTWTSVVTNGTHNSTNSEEDASDLPFDECVEVKIDQAHVDEEHDAKEHALPELWVDGEV